MCSPLPPSPPVPSPPLVLPSPPPPRCGGGKAELGVLPPADDASVGAKFAPYVSSVQPGAPVTASPFAASPKPPTALPSPKPSQVRLLVHAPTAWPNCAILLSWLLHWPAVAAHATRCCLCHTAVLPQPFWAACSPSPPSPPPPSPPPPSPVPPRCAPWHAICKWVQPSTAFSTTTQIQCSIAN